ncbi:peptidyl-prolyl cis-trans isomerase [Mesorhizobium delmotii]|uniref:Parvulin-like PPIase n=1 Tax=Mesorhizobium delmotii TaxID=1631247 RepID=A0A2P9ABB7_9HYPH|nr:peptidyl-prolyl cis-trans isomerase [Mesorhizobium delmotii]SJM28442.1 conserved hypothetical protein [Mesorhizobium delmotii]
MELADMKLLREPLLHFAVAGLILFSGYSWFSEPQPDADGVEPVQVGQGEVEWLKKLYQNQWLRPPDMQELQGLVTDLVNEELLAREAEAMGLGEDDIIIRRRLAQKLKFLVEDTARLAQPTDSDLRSYFEANRPKFVKSPRISFSHIYFNPANRTDATGDAAAALAGLATGTSADAASTMGDRFLLGPDMTHADRQSVSGTFGDEFADSLLAAEAGQWTGPLESGYGTHLVLVTAREAASAPAFEKVRKKVLAEWQHDQQQKASQGYLARLREKYGVELDDNVKALLKPDSGSEVSMR